MSCAAHHKVDRLSIEIVLEALEEGVRLIGEFAVVSDIVKRLHDLAPIHLAKSGDGVAVSLIIVIVEMEGFEPIMAENADGILRLLAYKRGMSDVKAGNNVFAVDGVDEGGVVLCESRNVGADALALYLSLPHILKCYAHSEIARQRNEGSIVSNVEIKGFLFVTEVGHPMKGMDYHEVNSHHRADLEGLLYARLCDILRKTCPKTGCGEPKGLDCRYVGGLLQCPR